jgi:hypothetical protein
MLRVVAALGETGGGVNVSGVAYINARRSRDAAAKIMAALRRRFAMPRMPRVRHNWLAPFI